MASEFLYRWECDTCRQHGRWLADGNTADALGSNHMDRNPSHSNYSVIESRLVDGIRRRSVHHRG